MIPKRSDNSAISERFILARQAIERASCKGWVPEGFEYFNRETFLELISDPRVIAERDETGKTLLHYVMQRTPMTNL